MRTTTLPPSKPATLTARKVVRCAIYGRVSTDDGLSQAFTSLDAQRASGESFIQAHKELGWVCMPERYEDGGFSGGTLERPALQRLLAKVEAGEIDTILVYKLDRFTRSIRDFGTLAGVLERNRVGLVSVTQSIDTSTSMGRLMMHVLLSFAAFERELASERTRDKILLSRQRGQWMGGRPPLGYNAANGALTVNDAEAAQVRMLFSQYLETRSIARLVLWATERGIRNKHWMAKDGTDRGGVAFVKSTMAQLLANPMYIGRVPHKGTTYPGLHQAIVDAVVFQRVQEVIVENGTSGPSEVRNRFGGILKGVLKCGRCGSAMVHAMTTTKGVGYRYYTCTAKRAYGAKRCTGGAAPAEQIERFVLDKVRTSYADPTLVTLVLDTARARTNQRILDLEARRMALTAECDDLAVATNTNAAWERLRCRAEIEADLRHVEDDLTSARQSLVDRSAVESSLEQFDGLWATLTPTEKSRVIELTVAKVTFDVSAGEIGIHLHETEPLGESEEAVS